jgi:hypothetical protein
MSWDWFEKEGGTGELYVRIEQNEIELSEKERIRHWNDVSSRGLLRGYAARYNTHDDMLIR